MPLSPYNITFSEQESFSEAVCELTRRRSERYDVFD